MLQTLLDVSAKCQVTETDFVQPATGTEPLCQYDARRYAIGFSNAGANPIRVSLTANFSVSTGIVVQALSNVWLDVPKYGCLPQQQWNIQADASPSRLTVYQVIVVSG